MNGHVFQTDDQQRSSWRASDADWRQADVRYRVEGHAGVWAVAGPALVVGDDGLPWEHPDFALVYQVADPGNVVVVGPDEVTAFDTPPLAVRAEAVA